MLSTSNVLFASNAVQIERGMVRKSLMSTRCQSYCHASEVLATLEGTMRREKLKAISPRPALVEIPHPEEGVHGNFIELVQKPLTVSGVQ